MRDDLTKTIPYATAVYGRGWVLNMVVWFDETVFI
jgi:hypothetical protein